ncbi:MAG: hypothetical protein IT423_07360 [Pirellulaceae bacterium]|nr:hypothetical protein [Pirellulaceae bacterium]
MRFLWRHLPQSANARIVRNFRTPMASLLATVATVGGWASVLPAQVASPISSSIVVQSPAFVPAPDAQGTSSATANSSNPASRPRALGSLSYLRTSIENGRSQLTAHRLPNPAEAKTKLINQMQSFEAYLGGAQSSNAQAWFKFLKWNDLLREVAAQEPNLRVLTDVELSYHQNIEGFEYSPYQAMRTAIRNYIDAQRFGANPEGTLKILDSQLEKLLKLTEADNATSELERMRDIGQITNYLYSANQTPELVFAFRNAYSQPNMRVMVGESFVNRAIGRPVNQPNPVNECVLGTRVLGNSFISGSVFADLVPHNNGVSVRLTLSGNFSSDNIGYNRGVKVYTTGSSPVYASKLISITPTGTITQPAVASTNLQTQINGIDHRLRIVRRIATRKAAEQKQEANAIGQYRLETRLAKQFNDQIEQQLAQGGGGMRGLDVLNQEPVELKRLGVPKPTWALQSNNSHILADFREADVAQLAAPGPSPLPKSATGIVAEVHQSLPINLAAAFLGGRTLHSWEMDDLVRQFTGSVPAELQAESEGKPWSLQFAEHHPLEVEFEDGLAIVSLRIVKMSSGEQELPQPATVVAKYRPVVAGGYLVLERQGDVEMLFLNAPRGLRAVTLRSFFKGKFDKLFKERSEPRSVSFTTRMPNLPQLTVSNVTFSHGWAQLTVQ